METAIATLNELKKLCADEHSDWDLKSNPNLFPLFLFQHFKRKYCTNQEVQTEESSYYSRRSVFVEYIDERFTKTNRAWFIVTTRWNTVCFFTQVGKTTFIPFSDTNTYPAGLLGYTHLSVDGSNKVSICAQANIITNIPVFTVLSTIANEIYELAKVHNLKL